jgi:hypothetical protein
MSRDKKERKEAPDPGVVPKARGRYFSAKENLVDVLNALLHSDTVHALDGLS